MPALLKGDFRRGAEISLAYEVWNEAEVCGWAQAGAFVAQGERAASWLLEDLRHRLAMTVSQRKCLKNPETMSASGRGACRTRHEACIRI